MAAVSDGDEIGSDGDETGRRCGEPARAARIGGRSSPRQYLSPRGLLAQNGNRVSSGTRLVFGRSHLDRLRIAA